MGVCQALAQRPYQQLSSGKVDRSAISKGLALASLWVIANNMRSKGQASHRTSFLNKFVSLFPYVILFNRFAQSTGPGSEAVVIFRIWYHVYRFGIPFVWRHFCKPGITLGGFWLHFGE